MALKLSIFRKVLMFFIIIFSLASCYKKKDTVVIVHVLDATNFEAIVGASVQLVYLNGNPDSTRIDISQTTDPQGTAIFNFNEYYQAGQAGFVVLDVLVNGTLELVLQIEEEKTTEETITI